MGRKKKVQTDESKVEVVNNSGKDVEVEEKDTEIDVKMTEKQEKKPKIATEHDKIDAFLPKKDLFRVDEVARYFGSTEQTIRTWIQHGIIEAEKIGGILRVRRSSILKCRFSSKIKTT